jgi:hypothetical protein
VLFVLIPFAWLVIVFFGVAMCRLAARSDESHTAALADWLSAHYRADQELDEDLTSPQRRRGAYRATG